MYRALARKFVILLAAFVSIIAAEAFAQNMLQLGDMSYARSQAPHLRMPVTRASSFFRGVGGVAFSAVAEGENGLKVVSLSYDAAAPDGSRLLVRLRDGQTEKTVVGGLYDWQLVPIARFAKDENGSAMTLFGDLEDKSMQKKLLDEQNRVINYHPALDNTLLGLRLFQADILIIQPNAADLFRKDGSLVLGAGESGHNLQENQKRFNAVGIWQAMQEVEGYTFQSYVVGDLDQKVSFSIKDGRLAFKGEPYWFAWRSKEISEQPGMDLETLGKRYEAAVAAHNIKIQQAYPRIAQMSESEQQQLEASLKQSSAAIESMESEIRRRVEEGQTVEPMPEYSRELTRKIRENQGVNPLVYAAVGDVMRYRALFKHFQKNDRAAYESFVNSLRSVKVQPAVTTPTIQYSGTTANASAQ